MGTWNTDKLMHALNELDAELHEEHGEQHVTVPVTDRETIHISPGHAPGHNEEMAYWVQYCTYGTPTRYDDGNSSTDIELGNLDDEELVAAVVHAALAKRQRELDAQEAAMDPGREEITSEHVLELLESRKMGAAMVRYPDGRVEVRSTVPTRIPAYDDYTVIVTQEELPNIDQSGMDFSDQGANLSESDLEALAVSLNLGEDV